MNSKSNDLQVKSLRAFHMMCALGYSVEEINIRKLKVESMDVCNAWFLQHSDLLYCNFAGSFSEGLEGNSSAIFSDMDYLFVHKIYEIYNSECELCVYDRRQNPNVHLHIAQDFQYPGYVRLYLNILKTGSSEKLFKHYFSHSFFQVFRYKPVAKMHPENFIMVHEVNGPALTRYVSVTLNDTCRPFFKTDEIHCQFYKNWPFDLLEGKEEFLLRKRPNNWPSDEAINVIISQGCFIAPVGHYDCSYKETQFRISFMGERFLFSQLTHVQILCYMMLKWIRKTELYSVSRDALTSFHMKHIILWCAQDLKCDWNVGNLLNCIKMCIGKLIMYLAVNYLPHFLIRKRNLFNSKLTEGMSERVIALLMSYEKDISKIFEMNVFKNLQDKAKSQTQICELDFYQIVTHLSVIDVCFYEIAWFLLAQQIFLDGPLWHNFEHHNAKKSLLNYSAILNVLTCSRNLAIMPIIFYVESMVGLLSYALYRETFHKKYLLNAYSYIDNINTQTKQDFDLHSPILFRYIFIVFMEKNYEKVIFICDHYFKKDFKTFINSKEQMDLTNYQLEECKKGTFLVTDPKEIENLKTKVTAYLYCKSHVSTKMSPAAEKISSNLKHLPVMLSLYNHIGVVLMTAEKWALPKVLQMELLSDLQIPAGIVVHHYLCALLLIFLSHSHLNNVEKSVDILSEMDVYIDKRVSENSEACTNLVRDTAYEPLHRAYNIVAYCNMKAKIYKKAAHYFLCSFKINPCRQNAAYGYLKNTSLILAHIIESEKI